METQTESPASGSEQSSRRALLSWSVIGALAVVALLGAFFSFGGSIFGGSGNGSGSGSSSARLEAETANMMLSSTYTTIDAAPHDTAPDTANAGIVVHPKRVAPVADAPDGHGIARMPTEQFGDTWLPVIAERPGWVQVLLPSKTNGSTGWLQSADVKRATTPYLIKVHLAAKKLDLIKNGQVVGTWKAGTGKPSAPTPAGRTFLLGAFSDAKQKYSPVILPLGAHSPTHDTFGGGPGTVAIHTWPTDDAFGTASSDGCIRIPKDALKVLTEVPLGTLVMINND